MADWIRTPLIVIVVLAVLGLLCSAVYWVAGVNKDRESIKENAQNDRATIKEFVKEIRKDIKDILSRLPPAPVAGDSPVRLTDFGQKISDKLEVKRWAPQLAPSLSSRIQGKAEFEI